MEHPPSRCEIERTVVSAARFDRADHLENLGRVDFRDRTLPDDRKDVALHPVDDAQGMGRVQPFNTIGVPGPRNLFEQLERGPLLLRPLPGLGGVLTLIEQPLGFGPLLAGDRQRDGRIFAEAQQFFLAVEAVFQAPELRSVRLDEQVQAFSIGQLVGALPLGGVFDLKFVDRRAKRTPLAG